MSPRQPMEPTPELRMAGLLTRLERARHALASQLSLGTADMRLLWLLSDGEPRTMRAIGEELTLEQSTVHRQVTAACHEGFLERRRSAGSTAWEIVATERGRRAFDEGMEHGLRVTGAGLSSMSTEEVAQLLDLLTRFVAGYGEAALGSTPTDASPPS